jgi:molybdopterin synthase catalytic subunit/molybdopterin converting factor small subunit
MRVRVLLFGPLAEVYGTREEWLDLGSAPIAADVYRHYRQRDPRIGELEKSLHIAVNQTIVTANHPLAPNDEVALLPPVCGGSGASEGDPADPDLIDLVETPLENHPWRKHIAEAVGSFGAVAAFEGLVRQDSVRPNLVGQDPASAGDVFNPVTALAFDAYRPMAIGALRTLAAEARQRWPIRSLVMLHRLGTVATGEICVVTAVATGHREEAFAACKYLIDTLKATVPIWKKEITASSSHWVDGVLLPK